jgi:sensor histidine kinase regulating citrate/malate metabolism
LCLTIEDNGLGLDLSRYHEKVFGLYNRFHPHIAGKGIGLCLVKTQISSLGGKIEIESEVNSGASFKVFFKINPVNSAYSSAEASFQRNSQIA